MRSRSAFARTCFLALSAIAITTLASAQRPQPFGSLARAPITHGVPARPNLSAAPNASMPIVATPVLSLAQGSYSGPQTVTVTDATPGAVIYYTTNGTFPATGSSPQYNGSITLSKSCTLVVMATLSGYQPSTVWATYYITSVPDSFVYTVAGTSFLGYAGDGGPATQAMVGYPTGTATDSSGNLYIADTGNNVVRKVDASTGIITTVAGNGIWGYSGDSGPATSAQLARPISLAFDSSGNLYIGQGGDGVVRKVTMSTGVISTYAGNPNAMSAGDGGPATSANLGFLYGIAMDSSNNLYILGTYTASGVREVDANTKIITTVAGGGAGNPASGGPATSVSLPDPFGIALDSSANIYIADYDAMVIWKVTRSTGNISIFAGTDNTSGYSGDGGPATSATLYKPTGVAVDAAGNVFINDQSTDAIRMVDAATGDISTYAGNDPYCFSFASDGSSASSTDVCQAHGLSVDGSGNLYYVDGNFNRVRKITAIAKPPASPTADPVFSLSPGTYADPQTLTISDATPGASIYLVVYSSTQYPYPIGDDSIILGGNASYYGPINLTGPETMVAVAVAPGHSPSNTVSASYNISLPPHSVISSVPFQPGPAMSAGFASAGIASDQAGNFYIADEGNNVVWKVSGGSTSIYAGTGTAGDTGDNGPATSATLHMPMGVAVDANGNLFIADNWNNVVREVLASNRNIIRYAGNGNFNGPTGDGGPATSATITGPEAVAVNSKGNVYVTDFTSVRKIDAATGVISTYAGGGLGGDGGLATAAFLGGPDSLAFDASDNLYIGNDALSDGRVRVVNAKTGIITTVAGNGDLGTSGDGLLATQAETYPNGIAVDGAGNLYIGSYDEIRKVDAKTGIISSIAGIGYEGHSPDGIAASAATICPALGLLLDSQSNIYFSDSCAGVRKITVNAPAPSPTFDPAAGSYTGPQSVTISDAAPNAVIYYTTDGSTPKTTSTQYSGPIAVTANETINAIAVAPGYAQSAVGSAAYKIILTPTITWAAPAAIAYGTALSATQLDATASVPGTFTYNPPAGTVLGAGSQTLSATFTPTDNVDYTTAAASVTLIVNPIAPTIALTSTTNPSGVGQSVTFTAAVTSSAGTPTGTVTFFDGTTQLGSGTLASGTATYATSTLAVGTHSITAQYSGDVNFAPVTSAALTQTVSPLSVGPASGAPTTASIVPGGTANFVLSVTPPGNSPVTLSVSGLPGGATSSFSPNPVAAGAGPTTVQFVINLPGQASAAPAQHSPFARMPLALGLLLLPFLGLRRSVRRSRYLLLAVLVIAGAAGVVSLTGCGSHNFGQASTPASTPAGAYTLTVTATAGSATQTTTLTLNVQ